MTALSNVLKNDLLRVPEVMIDLYESLNESWSPESLSEGPLGMYESVCELYECAVCGETHTLLLLAG